MATPIDKLLLDSKSDEELMSVWVRSRVSGKGNEEAFQLLWHRHRESLYRMIVRILGPNSSLADEIFQDAWIEVIRATRFVPGSFRSFIRTVATRKALDKLTNAAIRMADSDHAADAVTDSLERVSGPETDPARIAQVRESGRIVMEIVCRMPPVQRVAWTLRYVEGLTYDELAETMGTPVGTAKARVRLANEFIAALLKERGLDPTELEEAG